MQSKAVNAWPPSLHSHHLVFFDLFVHSFCSLSVQVQWLTGDQLLVLSLNLVYYGTCATTTLERFFETSHISGYTWLLSILAWLTTLRWTRSFVHKVARKTSFDLALGGLRLSSGETSPWPPCSWYMPSLHSLVLKHSWIMVLPFHQLCQAGRCPVWVHHHFGIWDPPRFLPRDSLATQH